MAYIITTQKHTKLNSIRKRILGLNCSDFNCKGHEIYGCSFVVSNPVFFSSCFQDIFSEANGIWNHVSFRHLGCVFFAATIFVCVFSTDRKNAPCQSGFIFFPPIIKGNSFQQKNPSSIAISFTFRLFCWTSPQTLAGSQ